MTSTVDSIGRTAVKATTADNGWLSKQIARSGTREAGGFTEAQLSEELDTLGFKKKDNPLPRRSNTIAWWQGRQQQAEQGGQTGEENARVQVAGHRVLFQNSGLSKVVSLVPRSSRSRNHSEKDLLFWL